MGFVRLFRLSQRHWSIHNGFSCVSPFDGHCYISGCRLLSQVSESHKHADCLFSAVMENSNTLPCLGSGSSVMSDPNLPTELLYGSLLSHYQSVVPLTFSGSILVSSWETNMRRGTYRSRRRKRFIRVGERILRIS